MKHPSSNDQDDLTLRLVPDPRIQEAPAARTPFTALPRPTRQQTTILLVETIPGGSEEPVLSSCLHRACEEGWWSFCNDKTDEICVGCGRPVCDRHWSGKTMYICDQYEQGTFHLCQQCAQLPREDVETLRSLRLLFKSLW